jgi:hypothetical protein
MSGKAVLGKIIGINIGELSRIGRDQCILFLPDNFVSIRLSAPLVFLRQNYPRAFERRINVAAYIIHSKPVNETRPRQIPAV